MSSSPVQAWIFFQALFSLPRTTFIFKTIPNIFLEGIVYTAVDNYHLIETQNSLSISAELHLELSQ